MVIDANTGAVLHNKAGDETVYPASLTKMMTLYMTFELIELGRLDYDSKIKMTEEGAAAAPSKLDLEAGEELTVLNAIKALVTKSANDVAIALAQHIGGTEANFARLMTRKAREIGMPNTTFRNASGLPDPEQITTARDMVTLGLRLQDDFPRHYRLFATRSFTYGGKNYRNHNTLLTRYRGTDGIKTGYTRASGFNLVSSVRRDGKHVVAAVFGGDTARERNAKMQSLLNAALAKASTKVTRKPALIARAPQPTRRNAAAPSCRSASGTRAAAACAAPPPSARERDTSIAVARVRPVRIGTETRAPRAAHPEFAPAAAQPVFAVAGAGGSAPPARGRQRSLASYPKLEHSRLVQACRPPRCRRRPSSSMAAAWRRRRALSRRSRRKLHARLQRAAAARAGPSKSRSALTAIPSRPSGAWPPPASAPAACSIRIRPSPSRCRAGLASSTARASAASRRPPLTTHARGCAACRSTASSSRPSSAELSVPALRAPRPSPR